MRLFVFLLQRRGQHVGIFAITRHQTPAPVYTCPSSVTAVAITLVTHVSDVSHKENSKVGKEKGDQEQK